MNPNRRKSTRCVEDEYPRPVRSRSLLKAHDSAEDVDTVSNSSEQHICLLWSRILLYLAFRNCSCVHDVSFILSLFSVFSVFGVSPLPATTCVCDLCYKWSVYGCGVYISRTDVCNIYIYTGMKEDMFAAQRFSPSFSSAPVFFLFIKYQI